MFTGIVETLGKVHRIAADQSTGRVVIETGWPDQGVARGDSVAVNGVCLTVTGCSAGEIELELGPETLARTNLKSLQVADRVNLERAALPTTRLGGHWVQGHVDGVGEVVGRRGEEAFEWMEIQAAPELLREMVPKGSVALDGVSLTLVEVADGRFRVMLIPHTLQHTTLGDRGVGTWVNIETDILGKYVRKAVRDMLA